MIPNMRATRFLVITMAVIFVAEGATMLFFYLLGRAGMVLPAQAEGILDASLLTAIVFPALYLLLFQPLVREMNRRKQVERSKDDLLAIMPHELRTPMAVIQEGLNQIIDGSLGPTTPKQDAFLRIICADIKRLDKIFDKVGLVIRLLTKQVKYVFQPLEMGQMINTIETELRPVAEQKGVTLKVNCRTPLPVCTVDGKRLAEAVSEVVENGIAATPKEGEVLISCGAVSGGVELSIQDGGSGIAVQEIPVFFDRLHSIGDIYERKTGGLGLGLFIAKAHIKAHGGSIRLNAIAGRGACVVIRIPARPSL